MKKLLLNSYKGNEVIKYIEYLEKENKKYEQILDDICDKLDDVGDKNV